MHQNSAVAEQLNRVMPMTKLMSLHCLSKAGKRDADVTHIRGC